MLLKIERKREAAAGGTRPRRWAATWLYLTNHRLPQHLILIHGFHLIFSILFRSLTDVKQKVRNKPTSNRIFNSKSNPPKHLQIKSPYPERKADKFFFITG